MEQTSWGTCDDLFAKVLEVGKGECKAELSVLSVYDPERFGEIEVFANILLNLEPFRNLFSQLAAGERECFERSTGFGIEIDQMLFQFTDRRCSFPPFFFAFSIFRKSVANVDDVACVDDCAEEVIPKLERELQEVQRGTH